MPNPAPLKVHSQVVQEGKPIPMSAVHTGAGGQNVSPDLSWDAPPAGTKSLAISCYDPDAPTTATISPGATCRDRSRSTGSFGT